LGAAGGAIFGMGGGGGMGWGDGIANTGRGGAANPGGAADLAADSFGAPAGSAGGFIAFTEMISV